MKRRILWGMIVSILGVIIPVQAAELKVPGSYSTIQAAIDAASQGDTVLVADGTYTGNGNRDIDFKGKAITVKSQNGAEKCILDCQGTEEDSHRGFHFHHTEDNRSILDGLTIKNGYIHYLNRTDWGGGAIKCDNASPLIRNCIITENFAASLSVYEGSAPPPSHGGGGIYCINGASPKIVDCQITHNTAGYPSKGASRVAGGGGLAACDETSSPTLINCTLSDNSAITGNSLIGEAFGGGIYAQGKIVLQECMISNNSLSSYDGVGGGVFAGDGSSITGCLIAGNTFTLQKNDSDNHSFAGGGILCLGTITISRCTIINNGTVFNPDEMTYESNGGGIRWWMGEPVHDKSAISIDRSLIANNSASTSYFSRGYPHAHGGGISLESSGTSGISPCQITHSTITGNTVTLQAPSEFTDVFVEGGGIYVYTINQQTLIKNCTITENSAVSGGGIYWKGGPVTLMNCILSDNFLSQTTGVGGGIFVGGWGEGEEGIIANTIFTGNEKCAVYTSGMNPSLENSLFFKNPDGDYYDFESKTLLTGADQINALSNASENLDGDPLFVKGRYGNYYLSQKAAGQSQDSPGVNAGSDTAVALELDQMFTRTDGGLDIGIVDLGRHYSAGGLAENYRLTVTVNGGHGTISPASGYYASGSVVQLQASPESHYFVKKWTGTDKDSSIATTNAVTMLMDRTVTIEFEFGYQIQRQVDGQGSVTTSSNRNYFTPGEQVTIQAIPQAGWMFDHWSGDISGTSNPLSLTVNSDINVKAIFIKRSNLSIITIGEGTITRDPALSEYRANSRVTLTATPVSGWTFRKWSGDIDSASSTVTIVLDKDKSVQAEFVSDTSQSTRCSLSVFIAGKGSVTPFGGVFTQGSQVTLTAAAEKGWDFVRWVGDVDSPSKTASLTLSMNRAKGITAVFEEITPESIVTPTPNTDDPTDDIDDTSTGDTSSDNTGNNNSGVSDFLNTCSFPSMVIVFAVMIGFTGLRSEI